MSENVIHLQVCQPAIVDEESAIEALITLSKLEKAQSQIKQLQLEIIEKCSQFFRCFPIEVVRFTQSANSINEAIEISNQEDQGENPTIERQTMVLALPIQWHQNSDTLKDMIPQRVIFHQVTEDAPDKTAVITVIGNNKKAFLVGANLTPGFGLGFDDKAAKSDLLCQFHPSNDLIENL